jgi:hypothetical protein
MKYLTDYIQEAQTKLFNEMGVFFAFNQDQFNESKVEGVQYSFFPAGMVCPREKALDLIKNLEMIHEQGIAQDIAENGKEAIIERELCNHEAFYTMHMFDTTKALEGYGITYDEVQTVFNAVKHKYEDQ